MRSMTVNFEEVRGANFLRLAGIAMLPTLVLAACFCTQALAQQLHQKTFSSAEEASKAMVTAAQNNDEKAMLEILGPAGKQLVSSGDDAEDAASRATFAQRYQEMHRLVKEPDGTTILYIGAHNWPTPIPLVHKGNSWYFDTEAGKKEILYRRVGRNEMSAIRVCQELVASEKEYSAQHGEYAQKIFSDEGKQDGLYWRAANGAPQSPIGPLVAAAVVGGSFAQSHEEGTPTPYRGYYFHTLERQGKDAEGGAKSYMANGKMTEGFAFVAYPAEYRSSGVMTFIVGADGTVFEKDLGLKTAEVAKAIKEYNPDSSWKKAEEQQNDATGDMTK
jgi:hypothetical protein